jgi:hypothetical protein
MLPAGPGIIQDLPTAGKAGAGAIPARTRPCIELPLFKKTLILTKNSMAHCVTIRLELNRHYHHHFHEVTHEQV